MKAAIATIGRASRPAFPRGRSFLAIVGPGLVVMLADTDAGSVITAAQSGAQWGYRLLLLQALLVPVLFIVQELTIRLGLVTGRGHGELIKAHFGPGWAWLSVSTLMVASVSALITEFTGIAGVASLYGIPRAVSITITVMLLLGMAWTSSYRRVESVAMALGAFELLFLAVAWHAHPDAVTVSADVLRMPLNSSDYLYLVAANIGAVIMPWMVFYQQSAVLDKGLTVDDLGSARIDTAVGAVITQAIMASVLVASAAALGQTAARTPLDNVPQIAIALTAVLGRHNGMLAFSLGILGASFVAAIVVSLTVAWGLGEVAGYKRSLQDRPGDAPWFYAVYSGGVLLAAGVVVAGANLIAISVAVEVMNALLLPLVLGFLFMLACKALPEPHRLRGLYACVVGAVIVAISSLGAGAAFRSMF